MIKKSLYLKGYTAKRLTDEFPEKNRTQLGVNKLSECCGTQAQLTGGQAAADRAVPALKKILRQLMIYSLESRGQAADPQDCP